MWKWSCARRREIADGDGATGRRAAALPMRRLGLAVLAGALVGGSAAQAGRIMASPVGPDAFPWVRNAGEIGGIGIAPRLAPLGDRGDEGWMRGSLYGAIHRRPPERGVVPSAGWQESDAAVLQAGGGIGVLSGSGSAAAGCLTVCVPYDPMDFSAAMPGTGGVVDLAGGGEIMQGGVSMEIVQFSPDFGGFSLTGPVGFSPGDLTFGTGTLGLVGSDGNLTQMNGAISPVPEPGSLAATGMAVLVAAGWLRARRRISRLRAGCFTRVELTLCAGRTYGYEAIT